jgi:hypothetical protein
VNSEGFRETLSEERQRGPKGDKMAENNAGREERPETGQRKRPPLEKTPWTPRGLLERFKEPKKRG